MYGNPMKRSIFDKNMQQVNLYLPDDFLEFIDAIAAREGLPRAAVIRRCLLEWRREREANDAA